jgi:hypothetical protein
MSLRERAEAELNNELAALVQHDNLTYPIPTEAAAEGGSSSKKRKKGQQVGFCWQAGMSSKHVCRVMSAS